ncbi:MAG: hypothetical protein OEQ47_10595 [Acidimicrobiia bacterium]|nr:hypothetical protein [Acidimicrobiia bacterium]
MANPTEFGLFVIWEQARGEEGRILADLQESFEVLAVHEITWTPDLADANFHRFYRGELEPPYGHLFRRQKGSGPFVVATVIDPRPDYQLRNNTDGPSMVNARFLDAKAQYRSWTPGPMQVHATSSRVEAARDLYMLLGITVEEYLSDPVVRGEKVVHRDLVGSPGWSDLASVFTALNLSLAFVVLRNFENLPDDDRVGRHEGVDLLVRDYREAVRILGGAPEHGSVPGGGGRFVVAVGDRTVRFALWPVGGGYFDPRWEEEILRRRVFRDGVPTPNDADHFDSLAYHAVVHKRIHHDDEWDRLAVLAHTLGHEGWDRSSLDLPRARALVDAFMDRHGYRYTVPDDIVSVYFNHAHAGSARPVLRNRLTHVRRVALRQWLRVRPRLAHPVAGVRRSLGTARRALRKG